MGVRETDERKDLYVLMILATAEDGCPFPKGKDHVSLVVVQAESQDEAVNTALVALTAGCWSDVRVRDTAMVILNVDTHPGVEGDAMRYARTHGFAIITYPE